MSKTKKIRGVVLAGGTGSRLNPLTKVTNKHLLPVGKRPMIYYPVIKMVQAGITEILIVTGIEHIGDVISLLGSGKEFNCEFTYKVQDEAGGIAQALLLAEDFAKNDNICVILGDNIFKSSIKNYIDSYLNSDSAAHFLLKEVHDPERFGVAEVAEKKIISIVEKPSNPKSNLAVTGIYFYNNNVFNHIRKCKPSDRNELEISDVNSSFLENSEISYSVLDGWWSDAGTFESLAKANQLVMKDPIDE